MMTIGLGHQRNDTIDVFRAIAILSVIIYHYGSSIPNWTVRWPYLVTPIELGRFGVHLFFIVSGMVIAMTLARSAGPADFAIKRFARIYPAYLVAMIITFAFSRIIVDDRFWVSKYELLENIVPYQFGQRQVDPSYWSLTYEIQFYVLAGLLHAWLRQRMWVGLAAATILGAVASLLMPALAIAHPLLVYLPLFLAGVGAWIVAADRRREGWMALAIAALSYFATAPLFDDRPHQYAPWMMHAFVVGLGGLLVGLVIARVNLRVPALPAIGRSSYSLYLFHQVIGVTLIGALVAHGVAAVPAALIALTLVMVLAALNYRYVEENGRTLVLIIARAMRRPRQEPSVGSTPDAGHARRLSRASADVR